ncbi:hypothetical protein [Microterricola viridarii]|uniref:Uncharacterized protein n=1 Tax=Microterricola viridarii TaxID=412690 RepID=A0A1H1UZU4_9MICO|nr:hypothetical protein [Microterricola viridarii]SDS77636.1 hypothetical protein SAMN04489834_2126 [Microterricola viridarii]
MKTNPAPDRTSALRSALLDEHAARYRRSKARRRLGAAATTGAAVIAIALTAAFLVPGQGAPGGTPQDAAPVPDYSAVTSGGTADIVVFGSPAELLPYASLVVTGRVVGIDSLEVSGILGPATVPVLRLDRVETTHGQREPGDPESDTIGIVLESPDPHVEYLQSDGALERLFPWGTQVEAYLQPGFDYEGLGVLDPWRTVPDPRATRTLVGYWPVHPQALTIQLPDTDVVFWPLFNGIPVIGFEPPQG